MDILLHLLSAKKHKMLYICVEDVPANSLSAAFIDLDFARNLLNVLPFLDDRLSDKFYVSGISDKTFCNRKVALRVSYGDFCRRACGPGEASGID